MNQSMKNKMKRNTWATALLMLLVILLVSMRFLSESKQENIYWEDYRTGEIELAELQELLVKNLPELKEYARIINKESNGKACLCIQFYEPVEVNNYESQTIIKCYPVYVGEKWDTYSVNWDWFYINDTKDRVFWYDILEDGVYSLETWRTGEHYRLSLMTY